MVTEGTPQTPATSPLEVQALYKIVNLIGAAVHLDTTLASILKVLHDTLRMERATLALVDESGRHLVIRASYGLSVEEEQRGVYGLDEGIYGQVFSTGSPCIVPDVHTEPLFLNRTGARPRIAKNTVSFIGVPVVLARPNQPRYMLRMESAMIFACWAQDCSGARKPSASCCSF